VSIEIRHQDKLLAIIIRKGAMAPGVHFVTQDECSLQLATMSHPAGKPIQPHVHNAVVRTVAFTNEVLVIQKGILRVDFYTLDKEYLHSRLLYAGDTILLTEHAGHGFEVIETLEMLEIKQGPYAGEADKTRFSSPPDFHPHIIE
jgi:mannose-6-phosphate isomerase-like protein (cupin superfamily)